MTTHDVLLVALYVGLLIALTPVLGAWMARIFQGQPHLLLRVFGPVERLIYKLGGVDPHEEMSWRKYAVALLIFNGLGMIVVLVLQLTQQFLPLNPAAVPMVPWPVAVNTAVSFMTNTNWQAYSGENTMSYLTQMLGLAVQNFLSAATGIAVLLAITRGLSRKTMATIGNFWADLVRSTLYVLLPLSIVFAVILVSQGVTQTFAPYAKATTLDGTEQVLPLGPAASQIAIKQLGSNGGGFYGVNSAHPFENPTPFSNFLEMFVLLMIAAASCWTFGVMVGARKQGVAIFAAMLVIFIGALSLALWAENHPAPAFGNTALMEGKEVRFGVTNSVLWGVATTSASNGSVNAMHDSFSPLAGAITVINLLLGEVVFGGLGAGLYGMLMFVILTVFLAGLMVGRTPEYLGKKIEAYEMRWTVVAILVPSAAVLVCTAIAVATKAGIAGPANAGPHAFTEILYAFASQVGNNGSAFAGLTCNTPFYGVLGAIAMFIGRFAVIIPVLAIAGSLAAKKVTPPSAGTFPTDGPLFVGLLIAVIVIVAALTFFPALALGPFLEHGLMNLGRTF